MRRPPPLYYLLLWCPARIQARLERLQAAGVIDRAPSLWQVWMGVLYMWTRVVRRPETIGLSDGEPERQTRRARLLTNRLLRLPAVLRYRVVNPLDQVGLGSSTAHIQRHLVGAYHPGDNYTYDLQILSVEPGALEALRERVEAVVQGTAPDATLQRDLVVYEGYHERLLAELDRWLSDGRASLPDHPDTTLRAFMAWCCAQPDGPAATVRALRRGELSLMPRAD